MTTEFRASDADRDRVADELRHHTGAGRLTPEESGERIALAYQARTLTELAGLTEDLPRHPPETSVVRTRAAPPFAGMVVFGALATVIVLLGAGLAPMCG
ncbi:DUF1707 SHOCT-like domain-containing protein [Actinopolyspora halophila]|uniref:DUF1707 SHOCT-like domain-containing protein n=1 Tax=Actinopolyspora halophila TaxID=1850 RepID=UPI00037BE75A|nr:DUF1707 domain-containing protein [Actinopolyspora halophila]